MANYRSHVSRLNITSVTENWQSLILCTFTSLFFSTLHSSHFLFALKPTHKRALLFLPASAKVLLDFLYNQVLEFFIMSLFLSWSYLFLVMYVP